MQTISSLSCNLPAQKNVERRSNMSLYDPGIPYTFYPTIAGPLPPGHSLSTPRYVTTHHPVLIGNLLPWLRRNGGWDVAAEVQNLDCKAGESD